MRRLAAAAPIGLTALAVLATGASADFNSYPGPKLGLQLFEGQKMLNAYGTDGSDVIVGRIESGKLRLTANGQALFLDGTAKDIGCAGGGGGAYTTCPIAFDVLFVNGFRGSDRIDATGLTLPVIETVDGNAGSAQMGSSTLIGGNADDKLYGGVGNDTITGGPGKDFLDGYDGNDVFHATDGEKDFVDCQPIHGPDSDTADADAIDYTLECEHLTQPALPPSQPAPDPEPTPVPPHGHQVPTPTPVPPPGATPIPTPVATVDPDDQDGDGSIGTFDCNDLDPTIGDNEQEVRGDGIDQNCDSHDDPYLETGVQPSLGFAVKHGRTTVYRIRLVQVPAGTTYVVSCTGSKCPKGSAQDTLATTATVSLRKRFAGRHLGAGAKLTISVSAPESVTYVFAYTTRKHGDPVKREHCLDPAGAPHGCNDGS